MPTLFEAPQKAKPHRHPHKHPHEHSKMRPLTSFAVNPDGIRFETQEAQEQVILFLRQHFIVNVPWIFVAGILILAPSFLLPLILQNIPLAAPGGYIVVVTLFWYLATSGFVLASF